MSEERSEHAKDVEQLSAELDQAHQVVAALVAERDELRRQVAGLHAQLASVTAERDRHENVAQALAGSHAALRTERDALLVRRDELLALAAKLTRETPYPSELDECRSARATLIAEVGTLRSHLESAKLSDPDRDAIRYAARLITNNPVAGCVDSISKNHTNMVNAARAVIARLLGGITL